MPWFRVQFQVPQAGADAAESLLEDLGAVSVTLSDAGDSPILEPEPGTTPRWRECAVEALFPVPCDFESIRSRLAGAEFAGMRADFLEDDDWVSRWRQYAVEFCFGRRLWLAPRDADVPVTPGQVVVRLDPGLAFGSGSHPTTRLCLDWLARADLADRRVLDFGCGSGVLALAARVLGCREAVAVDHDPQALLATRDNAAYNGLLDSRLTVIGPDALGAPEPFDVVVANILAGPLVALAPRLQALVRPGGELLLSGLLSDQVERVQAAYPGLRFEAPATLADDQGGVWVALSAHKPSQQS
jgi:ribosomal protein L11 methyltransferase